MSAPAQQLVEWVDDEGRVLGIVARSRVRAENLLHRSVFVAVRSVGGGELLVHRRAAWKDVWPGYWDLAAGGLCAVGEPWAAAARRELAEEVGIEVVDLEELGTFAYRDRQVAEQRARAIRATATTTRRCSRRKTALSPRRRRGCISRRRCWPR